jgi:hypothetical protein
MSFTPRASIKLLLPTPGDAADSDSQGLPAERQNLLQQGLRRGKVTLRPTLNEADGPTEQGPVPRDDTGPQLGDRRLAPQANAPPDSGIPRLCQRASKISWAAFKIGVPGPKIAARPHALQLRDILRRNDAADDDQDVLPSLGFERRA